MTSKPLTIVLLGLTLVVVACTALGVAQSQTSHEATSKPSEKSSVSQTHPLAPEDQGQIIFRQTCSRCHTAPEGFSPRISGTILRHMRVRASLSEQDERAVLHFLNP